MKADYQNEVVLACRINGKELYDLAADHDMDFTSEKPEDFAAMIGAYIMQSDSFLVDNLPDMMSMLADEVVIEIRDCLNTMIQDHAEIVDMSKQGEFSASRIGAWTCSYTGRSQKVASVMHQLYIKVVREAAEEASDDLWESICGYHHDMQSDHFEDRAYEDAKDAGMVH